MAQAKPELHISDEEYISRLKLTPGAAVDPKKIVEMLGVPLSTVKKAMVDVPKITSPPETDEDYRGRIIDAIYTAMSQSQRRVSVGKAKHYVEKIAIGSRPALEAKVVGGIKGIGILCGQYKSAPKGKSKKAAADGIFAQAIALEKAVGNWFKAERATPDYAKPKLSEWIASLKKIDWPPKLFKKMQIIQTFEAQIKRIGAAKSGAATSVVSWGAKRVEYDDMIGDIDGYQYSVGGIGSVGTSARGVVGYYDPYYANNGSQIESGMLLVTVAVLFIVLMCAFCIASAVFGFIMGFIVKKRNERKGADSAESEVFSDEMRV